MFGEMGWIWILLALVVGYFLLFYKSRKVKLLESFPMPPHHPILGIIPFFLDIKRSDILPEMCSWHGKHGNVVKLTSPFGTTLLIFEAGPAEKLFSSQANLTKGFDYDNIRPWLGDGLLMSTGGKWSKRRKMLTPAFHFKILEDFMQIFNAEGQKMAKIMQKECKGGKTFDVCHYVTRCALDIICETAMGQSVNAQDVPDSDYIKAINEFGRLAQDRAFRPWLRYQFLFRFSSLYAKQEKVLKVLHGFTEKVIAERKADFLKQDKKKVKDAEEDESVYFKSKKRLAFLDLLLEVQKEKGENELSDVDIREEVDTFMFEGHDTTSSNASFTIYALGCYPEIQKKVQEELDTIFGDDKERPITTEDLTKMKYLECVIKESLRVYPSVPFIQRKLEADIPLGDGRIMPKDVTVGIMIYQLHKDPSVFPEPNEFRPERFQNASRDPFAYVPFSAGPRNCIGQKFAIMEEKVMIATVMRYFTITSKIPPTELKLLSEMILRSEDGLPCTLTCR